MPLKSEVSEKPSVKLLINIGVARRCDGMGPLKLCWYFKTARTA